MTQQFSRVGFSVLVLALGGCWVGRASVSLPERLPSKNLPPLAGRISFDLCLASPAPPRTEVELERERRERGGRIQTILSPRLVSRPSSRRSLDRPWSSRSRSGGTNPFDSWSTWLSLLTFSLVPGYSVGSETLDVDLAEPGAEQGPKKEHLQYESREAFFFWAPLIVYPDLFWTTSGGWQSSKMDDADKNRFPRLVQRLADDIRVRLGTAKEGWGVAEQSRRRVAPEKRAIVSARNGGQGRRSGVSGPSRARRSRGPLAARRCGDEARPRLEAGSGHAPARGHGV